MRLRRLLAYAAIYILWGATYLAVRTVVLLTPPFAAAALRFLLSGVLLLGLSRGARRDPWPTLREWANSAKLGLVMFTLNYASFFWAEQRLFSGLASVIVATMPVWVMLAERLLAGACALPAASLAGTALGLAGVALVAFGGAGAAPPGTHPAVASCVLLAGTLCWSFGSVWSRSLELPEQQTMRSALQMTTGGLMLGVLALGAGEAHATTVALRHWNLATALCFTYLVVASIVAFTAYTWLLHHEPANRVATYAYANPLVAVGLGVGLGGERVTAVQGLGGGLVLLGVFATLRSRAAAPAQVARPA